MDSRTTIQQASKLTLLIGMGDVFSGKAMAEKKQKQNKRPTYATTDQLTSEATALAGADTALGARIDNIPAGKQGEQGIQGEPGIQGDLGTGPVGAATGDMQWWNVDHWEMIPVSANNTTLKNCEGIPTWVADHCAFQIGDIGPAGGWVFYITDAGQHGLEAAPVDQASAPWGCFGTVVAGTSSDIGTGLANTTAINAQCGIGTAAYNAVNYSSNGLGGWYLPSKDELNLMYTNIGQGAGAPFTNAGGFANNYYWSSTETGSYLAWAQYFGSGNQGFNDKDFSHIRVRTVRAF
jgi:hypothetical protein